MVVEEGIILRVCRLLYREVCLMLPEVFLHNEQHTLTFECHDLRFGIPPQDDIEFFLRCVITATDKPLVL